jgi:ABC-type dipeptide/oligopeptide/nickel transport system permease subunit
MNELIELSNYLLFNYWWIILPSCTLFGVVATYIQYIIENTKKETDCEKIDN